MHRRVNGHHAVLTRHWELGDFLLKFILIFLKISRKF